MVWDPFDEIRKMHEEMDKMFNRMFGGTKLLPHGKGKDLEKYEGFRMPLADAKETENSITAAFEIPGASKEDIDLNVTDNTIEVKAEKKAEKEVKEKGKYAYEARSHQFYRSIPLPAEVKAEDATAVYKDGVLKVVVPKLKKETKKKKIDIK